VEKRLVKVVAAIPSGPPFEINLYPLANHAKLINMTSVTGVMACRLGLLQVSDIDRGSSDPPTGQPKAGKREEVG